MPMLFSPTIVSIGVGQSVVPRLRPSCSNDFFQSYLVGRATAPRTEYKPLEFGLYRA
jgi:hypothetical protein